MTTTLQKEEKTPQELADYQEWHASLAGRKTKFNDALQRKIVKYLKEGNTIKDSCALADINTDTFYKYCKLYPDFSASVNEAYTGFKSHHIKNIHKKSDDDWRASQFLLASKFPAEFAQKSIIASSLKGEIKIIVESGGYTPTDSKEK